MPLDWLPAALDYLPHWIEPQVRLFEQPGCVAAVVHRDHLPLEATFGATDLGARTSSRIRRAGAPLVFEARLVAQLPGREEERA